MEVTRGSKAARTMGETVDTYRGWLSKRGATIESFRKPIPRILLCPSQPTSQANKPFAMHQLTAGRVSFGSTATE
jgi:hypothetical protein